MPLCPSSSGTSDTSELARGIIIGTPAGLPRGVVSGLEIRKISKEINEIDIENNPKIKFTTKGGIDKLRKRVEREKKEKNNKKER